MDREIKFRGKRVDNGEWLTGDLIRDIKGVSEKIGTYDHLTCRIEVEVLSETVGQFTGFSQNKDEFYENDICCDVIGRVFVIKWGSGGFWAFYSDNEQIPIIRVFCADVEKLGNIHDNPELQS